MGKDKGKKMAGFKFSLEKILSYREQIENEAKMQVAKIQTMLNAEKKRYADLKNEETLQEKKLANTPLSDLGERWLLDNYLRAIRADIVQTQQNIARIDVELKDAQAILAEKAKDKKIMEKLKEKHFELFKRQEHEREQREFDEIASIRFKTQTY